MSAASPPAQAPSSRAGLGGSRLAARLGGEDALLRMAGLGAVVAVSAVMNTVRLSQNGYANIFYSAGVRSMLRSWHNFLFVSFDPGGLVSVDKPPLALWVQAASAKLFGFSPLSLLLPEALMGVLAVAVLYLAMARRFGVPAALGAGTTLAVFPSFVAVSRANGVDTLLILLMLLACAAGIRACESGGWRSLLASGALIGLAFNTKTLAALLVVPGIALAYLLCSPAALPRRVLQLLAAGVVMAAVSFSWIAFVEATPTSKRPYVGSSTNNTELGLTFEYNGFGRVEGQAGGPGQTRGRPGAYVPASVQRRVNLIRQREHPRPPLPARTFAPSRDNGRNRNPVPFGGPPGPLRLFGVGLGDQAAWILPFAFVGLLAVLLMLYLDGRSPEPEPEPERQPGPARGRRDPRLAATLVLGGWLTTEAFVLSASKGIVHPYYVSALGPGAAAMTGAGAVALVWLCRRSPPPVGPALACAAVLVTLATEVVLMHREHYMLWFVPLLLAGAGVCLGAICLASLLRGPRLAAAVPFATALAVALLLAVPAAYAATTWLAPVESTFPAAGPKQTAGQGGFGVSSKDLAINRALLSYVQGHGSDAPLRVADRRRGHRRADDPARREGGGRWPATAASTRSWTAPAWLVWSLVMKPATCCSAASTPPAAATGATRAVLRGLQGAGPVGMEQPRQLPLRPGPVRLRRARTGAGRLLSPQAATDSSRWKARANSSPSRPAAQRGTAGSPSAISRRRDLPVVEVDVGARAPAGRGSARGPRRGAAARRSGPGARRPRRRTAAPSGPATGMPLRW